MEFLNETSVQFATFKVFFIIQKCLIVNPATTSWPQKNVSEFLKMCVESDQKEAQLAAMMFLSEPYFILDNC